MTDINQQILQKASGENRLDPDQQRHYMGTFGERVIFTVNLADSQQEILKAKFSSLLTTSREQYQPLFLKISPKLDMQTQMFYMKAGKEADATTSIINETGSNCPYALVLHTDHAIDLAKKDVFQQFPELREAQNPQTESKKTGFWKKLFGG